MNVIINNRWEELPAQILTAGSLMKYKKFDKSGTAIAINGKIVTRNKWDITPLSDGDMIMIISAAFGG